MLRYVFGSPDYQACTPTGDVLDVLLRKYKILVREDAKKIKAGLPTKHKKRIFLVITDGDPCKSFRRPSRVSRMLNNSTACTKQLIPLKKSSSTQPSSSTITSSPLARYLIYLTSPSWGVTSSPPLCITGWDTVRPGR